MSYNIYFPDAVWKFKINKIIYLVNKKAVVTYDFSIGYNGLRKLPGHPQYPNFSYEVILGLTNVKSGNRWLILN